MRQLPRAPAIIHPQRVTKRPSTEPAVNPADVVRSQNIRVAVSNYGE